MVSIKNSLFLLSVFLLAGCQQKKKAVTHPQKNNFVSNIFKPNPSQPITILVHGTRLPPPVSFVLPMLCQQVITPAGVHKASAIGNQYLFARIAKYLAKIDPKQFPLENMYNFGWSGTLSHKARARDAKKLYAALRELQNKPEYKETPITIITVSHGANLALNIAGAAQENNDTTLRIDRLILLCGPVQDATHNYIESPIFKKVFHIYSEGDSIQIADPQQWTNSTTAKTFFSNRTFQTKAPHIVQADIRRKGLKLGHVHFTTTHFCNKLPGLLRILESADNTLPRNNNGCLIIDLKDI